MCALGVVWVWVWVWARIRVLGAHSGGFVHGRAIADAVQGVESTHRVTKSNHGVKTTIAYSNPPAAASMIGVAPSPTTTSPTIVALVVVTSMLAPALISWEVTPP